MCRSGSTLDFSAAGRRFEPHYSSRRSCGAAASGKGKQRVGWQPPIVRGRWWGALMQVAGLIFFLSFVAVHQLTEAARQGNTDEWLKESKAGGAAVPGRARPLGGSTATGRVRTGDLCDDSQRW